MFLIYHSELDCFVEVNDPFMEGRLYGGKESRHICLVCKVFSKSPGQGEYSRLNGLSEGNDPVSM